MISKSGTLLYEISNSLTQAGFGQSITIGVGGDPVNGTRLVDIMEQLCGKIGDADYQKKSVKCKALLANLAHGIPNSCSSMARISWQV